MTQTPYCVNQIAGDVFVANGYGECKASQPFQKLKKKKPIDLPILLSGFATGIPLKAGFYLKNALFWNYCNSSSFYLNHNKLYITGKLLAHRL